MIKWPWTLLFASTPARFESAYGLDESVQRLAAASRRSRFAAPKSQEMVGEVTVSLVSLVRVMPLARNSFKPCFRGAFTSVGGRTLLIGAFGMHPAVRVFMCIWFGFLLAIELPGTWQIVVKGGNPGLLASFADMLCFGWAMLYFGNWLARNDIAWLSGRIQQALAELPE
jgi:hypothetical protein